MRDFFIEKILPEIMSLAICFLIVVGAWYGIPAIICSIIH